MKRRHKLPEGEPVEVILRKQLTYGQYKQLIPSVLKKGWSIQAYQTGLYSRGCKTKV